jgi:GTP pyrophosphokinase
MATACHSGPERLRVLARRRRHAGLLRSDAETRIAGLLFELCLVEPLPRRKARGTLRQGSRGHGARRAPADPPARPDRGQQAPVGRGKNAAQQAMAQVETLRKMLLAMASDMRVVLVRLASCVTTLRYFAEKKRFDELTRNYGAKCWTCTRRWPTASASSSSSGSWKTCRSA